MTHRNIIVIAHNIRSAHNVGSLLRTAEGLGVEKVFLTGYTPFPAVSSISEQSTDERLPHEARKINSQINKTALGAEKQIPWEYAKDISPVLTDLKQSGYQLCALEQTAQAIPLPEFKPTNKVALLLGSEVTGVDKKLLQHLPTHLVIPMFGQKESFNVVQAAAMALYRLRFD